MEGREKKEALLNALLKKTEELGRKVEFSDVKADENMPDPNDYAYFFRSFTDASNEVWNIFQARQRNGATKVKVGLKMSGVAAAQKGINKA